MYKRSPVGTIDTACELTHPMYSHSADKNWRGQMGYRTAAEINTIDSTPPK